MITIDRDRYDAMQLAADRATVLEEIESKQFEECKLRPQTFEALQAKHAAGPMLKFA